MVASTLAARNWPAGVKQGQGTHSITKKRSADATSQGAVDCARAGLARGTQGVERLCGAHATPTNMECLAGTRYAGTPEHTTTAQLLPPSARAAASARARGHAAARSPILDRRRLRGGVRNPAGVVGVRGVSGAGGNVLLSSSASGPTPAVACVPPASSEKVAARMSGAGARLYIYRCVCTCGATAAAAVG